MMLTPGVATRLFQHGHGTHGVSIGRPGLRGTPGAANRDLVQVR